MDYPIWDLTMGGGMLMALVAIPHVIVSHLAIGGGTSDDRLHGATWSLVTGEQG